MWKVNSCMCSLETQEVIPVLKASDFSGLALVLFTLEISLILEVVGESVSTVTWM